jgi:hypothetical protein
LSPDDVRALSELEAPLDVAADEAVAAEQIRRAAAEHGAEGRRVSAALSAAMP